MVWRDDYRMSVVQFGAAQIEAISNSNMDLNAEVRKTKQTRGTNTTVASLEKISPTGSFSTFNIKQAVDAIGVAGVCAEAGSSDDIVVFAELRECTGGAQTDKSIKYTIGEGVIAPQTLSVDHRGDATLSYTINAAFDGTNAPVAIEHDQTNPTLTAGSDVKYTMDKMIIVDPLDPADDVTVEGKIQINLDFGAQVSGRGADSTVADTVQALEETFQVLTVRGFQLTWYRDNVTPGSLDDQPVDNLASGKLLTGAGLYLRLYLKDRNQPASAVAHIEITVRGVLVGETIFSGGPDSPAECSFQMHLVDDGTNAPVIVNPSLVAIPA